MTTTRLSRKVPIVSMLVKVAKQALGSFRRVLPIIVSISNNKANNPFINTSIGGRGNSQSPSIVNVSIMVSVVASISTLFKFVKFCCGLVVDWFVVDQEPKSGVAILIWVGIFAFSLRACCTEELLLKMGSLVIASCLPLFLFGINEKSSSLCPL